MDLFSKKGIKPAVEDTRHSPLAERMRPRTLEEFVGQDHLTGPGKILRNALENDELSSAILWGPPGSGKTSLARIIAEKTRSHYIAYSAVLSGIKEIKTVMAEAERFRRATGRRTILFIDEIHRFNKAQQDAFLPYVEKGDIILIGATTENPSFEVIAPLLSRAKVYVLNPLDPAQIVQILHRALQDPGRGLEQEAVSATDELLHRLAIYSNGDARIALNTLEQAVHLARPDRDGTKVLTLPLIEEALQKKTLLYDKAGEEHFNLISALHKSLRNSDPDAAVYWLGRMLEAGEDPLYIARRLVRFASEDVGLADPNALPQAVAAMQAVHFIGMPEGKLALAQAVLYLAIAPKSNAVYRAYGAVMEDVERTLAQPVPLHLRNAPTPLMEQLGYGKGYQYAHDYQEKITDMTCLPEGLRGRTYYEPTRQGKEQEIAERLEEIERLKNKG